MAAEARVLTDATVSESPYPESFMTADIHVSIVFSSSNFNLLETTRGVLLPPTIYEVCAWEIYLSRWQLSKFTVFLILGVIIEKPML